MWRQYDTRIEMLLQTGFQFMILKSILGSGAQTKTVDRPYASGNSLSLQHAQTWIDGGI